MQSVIWQNMYSKTDAEEKMEVEASSETEQLQHSASYTEGGSDLNKAEPFVDDQPAQPTVQIRPSQQAICKFVCFFVFCTLTFSCNFFGLIVCLHF